MQHTFLATCSLDQKGYETTKIHDALRPTTYIGKSVIGVGHHNPSPINHFHTLQPNPATTEKEGSSKEAYALPVDSSSHRSRADWLRQGICGLHLLSSDSPSSSLRVKELIFLR